VNTGLVIVLAAITLYLVWLIVFLLVIERWLRRLVQWVFGVTIERQFERPVGKVELLDALFLVTWRVAPPTGLGLRFLIGILCFVFWMTAILVPIVVGLVVYFHTQ
jgi:hypothetical protein